MRLNHCAVALLLAIVATSAEAQIQSPVAAAISARNAGRIGEAIAALQQLAADHPTDAAILRLLASCYAAEHHYAEADTTLVRARRLAPDDRDIMLAQANLALWSGKLGQARAIADAIERIEPNNPELAGLRAAIRRARPARQIGISLTQSLSTVTLAAGHQTWRESAVALDLPVTEGGRMTLEVQRSDREFAIDTGFGVRFDQRIGTGTSFYAAVAATPHPQFQEQWGFRAGGETKVGRGIFVTLDGRYAQYPTAHVEALEPGLRLEEAGGRFALSLRSINLWDETGRHRNGWAARSDFRPSERIGLFAGVATYPDTEAGVTRRVRSAFGGLIFALNGAIDLRLSADHEDRLGSYKRTGASLGLHWRFGR